MALKESFTPREIQRIMGMTPMMTDYLCRTGLLKPSASKGRRGRGKVRRFTYGDIVYLKSLKALLDKGVSVKKLSMAVTKLQEHSDISSKIADISKIRLLVTDGINVFRVDDGQHTVENLTRRGQLEFVFVLDQAKIRTDLDLAIQEKFPFKTAAR